MHVCDPTRIYYIASHKPNTRDDECKHNATKDLYSCN